VKPFATSALAQVMVETGRGAELRGRLETLPEGLVTSALAVFRHARGVVRLADGDHQGGVDDLRAVGHDLGSLGTLSPGVLPWRAQLAEALADGDPDESRELAEDDLRRARAARLPAAEGMALRALALSERDGARIERLEEAVAVLEPSEARLAHARALTDLGVALRTGERSEHARQVLLAALDMAYRCGAKPLAERARAEAVAAGARPRRPYLTGVQALTPSELRVARLAASGQSNTEIAQALFVTKKTVADHLRATYRKLGVSRRKELPRALRGD
jgi:DNA-binding CsgD family transcriptional regulator